MPLPFNKEDRSKALDLLGVQSQLVFPTSPNVWLESLEHGEDIEMPMKLQKLLIELKLTSALRTQDFYQLHTYC